MNYNYSQPLIDDVSKEIMNNVKDQILIKNWDEIKNDKKILTYALSNSKHINAGAMIDMERVNLLSKIFSNRELIKLKDMNSILKVIVDSTDSGPDLEALDRIIPGLKVNNNIDWAGYKQYASQLLNGYNNLKNIALSMIAEDLYIDVQALSRLSPEQINSTTKRVKVLAQQIIPTLNKTGDLSREQFEETCGLLKLTGRTNFEIVNVINHKDRFAIVDLFTRVKQALEIVQYAQSQQSAHKLNNIEYIAEVIDKINNI